MIPFIENSKKYKLMYSDRKQINSCLGMGAMREGQEKKTKRRNEDTLGDDRYSHYPDYGHGFMNVYMSKLIDL